MMGIGSNRYFYTHLLCLPAVDVIQIEALKVGIDLKRVLVLELECPPSYRRGQPTPYA